MSTKDVVLSKDWQQLTDAGTAGFIQIVSGLAYICESEMKPSDGQVAHPRGPGDINFNDAVVWGRSRGEPVLVIISGVATDS